MIDFHQTWLPQVIRYAELISQEDILRRAWLDNDRSETSIYYPGELVEQVFDGLDAEGIAKQIPERLSAQPELATAIQTFLDLILEWSDWVEGHLDEAKWGLGRGAPEGAEVLFESEPWLALQAQARKVLRESRR